MNKRNFFILFSIAILLFVSSSFNQQSVSTLSRYGSRGEEVRQIQTKLKSYGYKVTKVDGVYGVETMNAVRQFQRNNGLTVDGVAGRATLAKIGVSTTTTSYEHNVQLLARLINSEARGEPFTGQVAVGAVVLNRVKHPSFPNTIAGVIYQPGAFTAITDGQWYSQMSDSAYRAARYALNGWDPSYGAIYYYNPAKTTNKWIYSRPVTLRIGLHVFAK